MYYVHQWFVIIIQVITQVSALRSIVILTIIYIFKVHTNRYFRLCILINQSIGVTNMDDDIKRDVNETRIPLPYRNLRRK